MLKKLSSRDLLSKIIMSKENSFEINNYKIDLTLRCILLGYFLEYFSIF